jgi:hypothetical protein
VVAFVSTAMNLLYIKEYFIDNMRNYKMFKEDLVRQLRTGLVKTGMNRVGLDMTGLGMIVFNFESLVSSSLNFLPSIV